jgi:nucleoside-diphosphate-sugar epimerase
LKKKILVIGGTGFIGFHLIKKLRNKKFIVDSISTKQPLKKRTINGVKYILTDISNLAKLKKSIKKNSYIYVVNLAGYVDHSNKKKTLNSHFIGCKNLVNIFLNSKIKKFIQIGSSGEYGNMKSPHYENFDAKPLTIYNLAKKKASDFLINSFKNKRFPVTIFRLYLAYGPNQDENRFIPIVIKNCLKNKFFDLSHCNQYRDFIYIDDFVKLIIKSFKIKKSIGEIFNVGSGKPIKLKIIINKIKKHIKGGKPIFGTKKLRKDEIDKIYPNLDKTKKIFKWSPKTSINNGLLKTVKFYKKSI